MELTNKFVAEIRQIIDHAQETAYRLADLTLVRRNWLLGRRIAEEELGGADRAEYGAEIIKSLSRVLTDEYGKGFDKANLYHFLNFYKAFPIIEEQSQIVNSASRKSGDTGKVYAVSRKSDMEILEVPCPNFSTRLSWTHYRILLQVTDKAARDWYVKEAEREGWGVRTLQRNVSSQYYYRMLQTYDKEGVHDEMKKLTAPLQQDKLEYIKSPVVAEFLGLGQRTDYHESTLEASILTHLQEFLMEMGKGYAFVARQQHIHTEKRDYYIDLVFYNIFLKCYVLVDLKTTTVTHQDVGQMDMYVRMYDELRRTEGDNPTIGILLCADTDDDIARFSVLKGNEQLFASKYITYMPSKEQLREEIERQKMFYLLQQKENEETGPLT